MNTSEPRVLVIREKEWLRGEGPLGSSMYRSSDGRMCCLGFDAEACGVQRANITDVELPVCIPPYVVSTHYEDTRINALTLTERIAKINDDPSISDEDRKARLVPLLKQLGWDEVRFE